MLRRKKRMAYSKSFSHSLGSGLIWLASLRLKCFGLKRKAGKMLKRVKVVFKRARFRAGSNCMGSEAQYKEGCFGGL